MPTPSERLWQAYGQQVQPRLEDEAIQRQQDQQNFQNSRARLQDIYAGQEADRAKIEFDQKQKDRERALFNQSVQTAAGVASKALAITDPVQRKGYLQQAIPMYQEDFARFGTGVHDLPSMLQQNDQDLENDLKQVAAFGQQAAAKPPAYGQPVAGVDAKGNPIFQRFSPDSPQGVPVAGFSPRPYATDGNAPASGFDDPRVQDLQAAISAAGYSLPAGFRSKEQQLSLMRGLLRKYDGLAADDVAHLLANNAVDYAGIKKATQTAAGIAGKVEFANKELEAFAPIALDASASVDRGRFVPINKLMQMGQKSLSDPNLKRLYVATQSILNSYNMLSARGGTDADVRAHNRQVLMTADSPEAYQAAVEMIIREGKAAGGAAERAMDPSSYQPGAHTQGGAVVDWSSLK